MSDQPTTANGIDMVVKSTDNKTSERTMPDEPMTTVESELRAGSSRELEFDISEKPTETGKTDLAVEEADRNDAIVKSTTANEAPECIMPDEPSVIDRTAMAAKPAVVNEHSEVECAEIAMPDNAMTIERPEVSREPKAETFEIAMSNDPTTTEEILAPTEHATETTEGFWPDNPTTAATTESQEDSREYTMFDDMSNHQQRSSTTTGTAANAVPSTADGRPSQSGDVTFMFQT